jgi:signal transduction histidine kinase
VRFKSSLFVRLSLALLGPLLLAMLVAWAIGVGIVTRALEQRVERQSRNAVTVMATWGLPHTLELLRRIAALQQADLALLDRDGRIAVITSETVRGALAEPLRAFLARPRHDIDTFRLETPVRSVAIYQPIKLAHDPRYSALVAVAPLADAEAAARRAAVWLGIAMLAAAALLCGLLLMVVRNITRPLSQLSGLADRIAGGEREQSLDLHRADEIGALAEALNSMMVRLRDYEMRLSSRSRLSALGDISARLAHEIRNPLTGLKLHLQLLAERVDATESTRVARLLGEVQRLELLVSSTLMLGREQTAECAPTALAELIHEIADLMGPSLAHRSVELTYRCDETLRASVDSTRLRQAILNLVTNAADAMPQGGRLLIAAAADTANAVVAIAVEDSGPGDPEAIREGLLDASASTKPFGLGLGLAVCRDVAGAHGGTLEIERSAELGGVRFVITLPWTPPPTASGVA